MDVTAEGGSEERRFDALRERYWELAGVEGVGLRQFVEEEIARDQEPGHLGRLRRLVDEVVDTALQNIAFKAEEEGGVYEALADERMMEVAQERQELVARLDRAERERS